MKIELKKTDAEKVFKMVSTVNQNNMIPISNESLISFNDEGRMVVFATDTEISIETTVDIVSSEGKLFPIVCDTNMILKTISSLKTETIFMEVVVHESKKFAEMVITVPKSKKEYRINMGFQAKNFLKKPAAEFNDSISIVGSRFAEIIKSASVFVDNKDIRGGWMVGISMYHDENTVRFLGGDGFGFNILNFDSEQNLGKIIIPKTIGKIIDLFSVATTIELSVSDDKNHMMIRNGVSTYTIRLVAGEASTAERVFKDLDRSISVKVNREEMIGCVGRLMNFANTTEPVITMDFTGPEVTLECNDVNLRKKGVEDLPKLASEGDISEMICSTNAKKLDKILRTFSCEIITIIKSKANNVPIILHDDSGRGFYSEYYLAPMKV